MLRRVVLIVATIAGLVRASSPVSFRTHYIALGEEDSSVAMAADGVGNIFVISKTVGDQQNVAIRATKTDPQGKVVATLDFGQGVTPCGATVDSQGNLVVVGNAFVAKLDNALSTVLATANIGDNVAATIANAVTTDSSGNIYVAGASSAADFPKTPGAYEPNPPHGDPGNPQSIPSYAFVVEFSADLKRIVNATLFGGETTGCGTGFMGAAQTGATAIALAPLGLIVIVGNVAPLGDQFYSCGFAAKFSADLSTIAAQNQGVEALTEHFSSLAIGSDGGVII